MKIPDTMSFDAAAFSEPYAIGMYAVRQAACADDARIGILGAGPIGLSVYFSLKAQGIRAVYMTDRLDYRAAFAARRTSAGEPIRTWLPSSSSNQQAPRLSPPPKSPGRKARTHSSYERYLGMSPMRTSGAMLV